LTNALTAKFEQLFSLAARPLAEKMVTKASRASEAQLSMSLKKLSGGVTLSKKSIAGTLRTAFKASVTENVGLIKSIATDYQSRMQGAVMRSITTGNGLKDLTRHFESYEGITKRKAKNLAIDQTRKAYNTMNAGRMKKSGIKKYQWLHSGGGQKPRPDHIAMNGNIYSFDDPPVIDEQTGERGIPGQAYNCGCTMLPIVEFDEGEYTDVDLGD
jgi:SPP1 gp7 family putative phage head morphogenesis protein